MVAVSVARMRFALSVPPFTDPAEVLAVVRHRAGQQSGQDLEGLVGDRRARAVRRLVAEVGEVEVGRVAQADAQRHPAGAQVVEGDQVLGDHPRPAPGQRGDHRADPDARRLHRDRAEHHPRVVDVEADLPAQVVP